MTGPSFTCPCCGVVSYSIFDVTEEYCGVCHWQMGNPILGPYHLASDCPHRMTKVPP